MSIVSSVIAATDVQKDGRKWVHEIHTDNVGLTYDHNYLAGAADDLNAALAAYAIVLAAAIQAAEIAANVSAIESLGSLAVITTNYATAAQTYLAARAAYATATQIQAVMIGDFLSSLTTLQLQTAFNFANVSQVTALRSSFLTPAATAATTVRASVGT